jgi:AcrR family transcriptional regulator
MNVTRTYHSPLREQQTQQTRELILERAMELLADSSITELTVADAAKRAGVSVRTAYRYFPTKESLFDGLNQWFMRRWGPSPKYPERLAQLPDMIRKLYLSFQDNEPMMRASLRTPQASEVRARRKQQQAKAMEKLVAAEAPHLPAPDVRKVAGVLHALMSADNYLNLRDAWGLSVEEATEVTLWGIEAAAAQLRRQAKPDGRKRGGH